MKQSKELYIFNFQRPNNGLIGCAVRINGKVFKIEICDENQGISCLELTKTEFKQFCNNFTKLTKLAD
jgi:hypothetical protein